jgi:hypothetical protein
MEFLSDPLVGLVALIIVGAILRMNRKRLQSLFQSNNTAERSNTMNWKRGITDWWGRMFLTQPQERYSDYLWRLATAPAQSSAQSTFTQAPVTRPAQSVGRTAYDDNDQLSAAQAFMAQIAQTEDWIQALVRGFHVLTVGGQRGGKTVLTHEIAERRAAEGDEVYVIDPDGRPGMWPSAKVTAGYGDDFEEADRLLEWFETVIKDRREERRNGRRKFPPITLVITELGAVMAGCVKARETFEEIVRRGAKLGIRLLTDVQDNQVKTLKLEGASSLLINLTRVEVARDMSGKRTATIEGRAYVIPQLTDPEALADAAYAQRGVSSVSPVDTPGTPVPVRDEGAQNAGTEPSYQYRTSTVPATDAEEQLDHDIKLLHSVGISWNKIGEMLQLKGQKQARNARIRQALGVDVTEIADAA